MKNERSKIKSKIFFLLIFEILFFIFYLPKAHAANSSNANYNIDVEEIDTSPGDIIEKPKIEKEKPPEQVLPLIEKVTSPYPLSISLTTDLVDFGPLTPGNPVTRVLGLSVLGESIDYHVFSYEDRPLTLSYSETSPLTDESSTTIADTTCEDGSCSEIRESSWDTNLTYGFGMRCDNLLGKDCLEFTQENYYKQFADQSKKELPQILMSGKLYGTEKKTEITLKINSVVSQKPGNYKNNVTFIAVPNF